MQLLHLYTLVLKIATPKQCDAELGLRDGRIPTDDISVSSQKTLNETLDTVRLGNPKLWTAARDDEKPWIEICFLSN